MLAVSLLLLHRVRAISHSEGGLLARDDLRAYLTKKIHEQYTEQELRDYSRALAALGAVPAGTDILAVMLSLYDEQVGAFYVPEERALYTFKDMAWSRSLDRMLLAHELTHFVQQSNSRTSNPIQR